MTGDWADTKNAGVEAASTGQETHVSRNLLHGLVRVALLVLLVKLYSFVVLYAIFAQTTVTAEYEAFLFLEEGQTRSQRLEEARGDFLDRLAPYDGQFYLDIAANGYRKMETPFQGERVRLGNYAFFPLFPFLLRALRAPTWEPGLALAILLNVLFSTAAGAGVWLMATKLEIPAWSTLLLMLSFPTAVFQNVLYGESLFLFLSVGTAVCAVYHSGSGAAVLGYLGALCRPQGVLLGTLALGLGNERDAGSVLRGRRLVTVILTCCAPVLGLITFAGILHHEIGSALGFLEIQANWGRALSPFGFVKDVTSASAYRGPPIDLFGFAFAVVLLPFLWRCLPRWLALYGTASVALPLFTGSILSFGRFVSVSFPHFLCLAKLLEKRRWTVPLLVGAFVLLQTLVAKGLLAWLFVG